MSEDTILYILSEVHCLLDFRWVGQSFVLCYVSELIGTRWMIGRLTLEQPSHVTRKVITEQRVSVVCPNDNRERDYFGSG